MRERLFSFLVVCLFFFSEKSFSQQKAVHLPLSKTVVLTGENSFIPAKMKMPEKNTNLGFYDYMPAENYLLLNPVSPAFYTAHLGFFCKKELQLEKMIAVPVRFRLGSLSYVNYLEQKPNAHKPQY